MYLELAIALATGDNVTMHRRKTKYAIIVFSKGKFKFKYF